ncbi:hypothetical protein PENSPDRAFT_652296 [Peniophora sp. CONT]|nr:hypothetical protein PENSPDRAFT_652296 [Peniophora sp. CONT]
MAEIDVAYPTTASEPRFRLLELPPDLCKLVESSPEDFSLTIKGSDGEDAVLCTSEKTYTIRSVVLSNAVLVLTPPPAPDSLAGMDLDDLSPRAEIQESLHEILELTPTVPKLHRLRRMLRGMEWDEGQEEGDAESDDGDNQSRRKRVSYDQVKSELQASDREIERAIRDYHILIVSGALRPIAPTYLHTILELLLTYLVALSQPHDAASVAELTSALESEHDVRREVALQVMQWFGEVNGAQGEQLWSMDVPGVVRQVGLGLLRNHRDTPVPESAFLESWRAAVGDVFVTEVNMRLLAGNYLSAPAPLSISPDTEPQLTYFPRSELPTEPSARFTDLFLTRVRWKATDIAPFLDDIAVDSKDRDKLLLKYARAVTESDGLWYTARSR